MLVSCWYVLVCFFRLVGILLLKIPFVGIVGIQKTHIFVRFIFAISFIYSNLAKY